jgi:Raf kinase inhibitor-like YbhB/YbcL family protein
LNVTQGCNDFGRLGFSGPCPPGGIHRYFFRLYAVDGMLELSPGATRQALQEVLKGRVLAEAKSMGTFSGR